MEAVAVVPKLPTTLDDLEEGDILRIPATWDEYLDLAGETDYTIQYLHDEIIIMSQATVTHEQLVIRLGKLFANYFDELDDYLVLGSNVRIVMPDQPADFQADLSLIHGAPDFGLTPAGRESRVRLTNPEIVVEVLSKGTRKFDLGPKLSVYQTVESLKHVLLVEQNEVSVQVYSRTNHPDQWLLTRYHNLADVVPMGDFALPLTDLYRKIDLSA